MIRQIILSISLIMTSVCFAFVADAFKPVEAREAVTPTKAQKIPQAEFAKLAKHTLIVPLAEGNARAVGGELKPETSLPLKITALPKNIISIIPAAQRVCQLVGLMVETDNRIETREWLVMSEKKCLTKLPNGWRFFWVVQQGVDGKTRLLLSDKADSIKLNEWTTETKADSPTQRAISVIRAGRTCANCGSIHCEGSWVNKRGAYQRPSQFLVEHTVYDPMSGLEQSLDVSAKCPLD
ncbi:hypothetical protein [uncultured Thiothrix sp.]|uniref:hypothetical protein n=1 Tax=uncultured Thiothrix sp. TaxID=223185 RepID=UPI00261C2E3A|nr:hypothetical protein [uncultured Thiothrix sp.]